MHPQMVEALLNERVKDMRRDAAANGRARLARRTRHGHAATVSAVSRPAAVLSSLSARRNHAQARHAAGQAPRRAA
jgi:hypothetical protein